jgi:AraC-like DNA-binding protein
VAALQSITFRGRRGTDPVTFVKMRHFAFSAPDGRIRIESAALGTRGSKLFSVRSTGHEVALAEETHVNVIVPLSGRIRVATTTSDFDAGAGDVLMFGPNERRTVVVPDDTGLYEALLLAIPCGGLASDAQAESPPEHAPFLRHPGRLLRSGPAAALAADMCDLMSLLRRGARSGESLGAVAGQFADLLIMALTDGEEHRRGPSGSVSQVRRAEAFMAENTGAAIRIDDIALAAGLSIRGLQAAFMRHRGMTPHQALTRARLEQVRLRLLQGLPGDRVTDVALHWGFAHLGRFSQTYARRFGESPSATLRRAQSG